MVEQAGFWEITQQVSPLIYYSKTVQLFETRLVNLKPSENKRHGVKAQSRTELGETFFGPLLMTSLDPHLV